MTDQSQAGDQPASASQTRAAPGAWLALFALSFVFLVNFMDRQLFAVLQEQIKADLLLSDSQLALLGGTMFAVFYATLGLPIAWLADRTNRIRLIAAACAVWSVFTAISGAASNFATMALARIGVAAGEAGGVSPSYSVLSDYFPAEKRGLAIGVFSVGAPLGIVAGSFLGALVADAVGWRWTFVILGAPGVLLGLALWLLVREPKRGRFDTKAEMAGAPSRPTEAFQVIFATPSLLFLALGAAATSFTGYALYQWIPSFLQRAQGLELDAVGRFLSPVFALGVIGALAGGWLADRLGRTHPAAYALVPGAAVIVAAPLFLAALVVRDGTVSLWLLTVPTLLSYVWIGPVLAAGQTLVRPQIRASIAAIMAFLNNLIGFGLGPLLVGAISDGLQAGGTAPGEALRFGLMTAVGGYGAAALCFLCAGFFLKADLERRKAAARAGA